MIYFLCKQKSSTDAPYFHLLFWQINTCSIKEGLLHNRGCNRETCKHLYPTVSKILSIDHFIFIWTWHRVFHHKDSSGINQCMLNNLFNVVFLRFYVCNLLIYCVLVTVNCVFVRSRYVIYRLMDYWRMVNTSFKTLIIARRRELFLW